MLAEPFWQPLWLISTTLSAFYVGQLHVKASVLYNFPTKCCKNQLKWATDPSTHEPMFVNLIK
ncbi:hypothetical protein L2689_13905 [Shewanella aestuarii]|uniref:Uncharacterized protein n=1 Tax=Shewanella aestuarii TaxID=1028752 RepID=A0ABT0L3M6_9GAMM|nr:hypothetical protein [Shewanella aestuarii]